MGSNLSKTARDLEPLSSDRARGWDISTKKDQGWGGGGGVVLMKLTQQDSC